MAKPLTEYLVMLRDPESKTWEECETREARSARAAISGYVRERGIEGGEFVAVPTRSFEIITVATETQTRIKFS
jgi:hypothetical protein